jgi:hypothetical protein
LGETADWLGIGVKENKQEEAKNFKNTPSSEGHTYKVQSFLNQMGHLSLFRVCFIDMQYKKCRGGEEAGWPTNIWGFFNTNIRP